MCIRDTEGLGEVGCDRAEHEAVMIGAVLAAAGDAQQIVIGEIGRTDRAAELTALRPLDFDRRDREEQGTRKVTLGADAGLL